VFEDGAQRRDFVHVDDVAQAVVAATTADPGPGLVVPLNVGSGAVTTVGGLAQALADTLDGPAPVVTGEFRIGDVRHVTASSARAAQVLGWTAQIGLRTGLATC
jgi:dTDP-L-rhamnose 4-epimerase